MSVGQKVTLHGISWSSFIFSSNKTSPNIYVLHSLYLFPVTTVLFITMPDELFYSLLTQVPVLRYQPSCHNHLYCAIIFNFVAAGFCFTTQNGWQELWDQLPWYSHRVVSNLQNCVPCKLIFWSITE